jgi:23S rRNA pseudouridine1911/1915/1917 synthase
MIQNLILQVESIEEGLRLDKFLAVRFPATSRAMILESIDHGHIQINGRRAAKGRKLVVGETVTIRQLMETTDRAVLPDDTVTLDIIYEDDDLLAFNKPAGRPVHPLKPGETGTLANGLIACYPTLAQIGDDPMFPALVHRIDTDTSGLVIAAKNEVAYANLRQQFREQRVTKIYSALVHGNPPPQGVLEGYLTHQEGPHCKMQVLKDFFDPSRPDVFKAITQFKVAKRFPGFALLEVTIPTGVTHQIRCQLAEAGYPIVGDKVYGKRTPMDQSAPRHFLHAERLELRHPATGKTISLHAPLPQELKEILNRSH